MKKELVSDFADLFPMEEFVEMVNSGFITEYDGHGYVSDGVYELDSWNWKQEQVDKYDYVAWYNK